MYAQFLLMIPGSIMNEDGHLAYCKDEADMHKQEAVWRDMGFSEVIVYEKIS